LALKKGLQKDNFKELVLVYGSTLDREKFPFDVIIGKLDVNLFDKSNDNFFKTMYLLLVEDLNK